MTSLYFLVNRLLANIAVLTVLFFAGSSAWAHVKGLYATEAEAQTRAKQIGCTTVHQNNGKWMPCADERELHRQLRKQ